jgi:hypothetical protein
MDLDAGSGADDLMEIALQPVTSSYMPNPGPRKRALRGDETLSSPPVDQDELPITYPEGGIAAWTVALGSWCSMAAGLGIINSTGVFQAYVSNTILASSSPNDIGWLFGIYVFVSYFCGVQIGPIFDARGPRELMLIGAVCLLVGTFALGQCTSE